MFLLLCTVVIIVVILLVLCLSFIRSCWWLDYRELVVRVVVPETVYCPTQRFPPLYYKRYYMREDLYVSNDCRGGSNAVITLHY